MVHEDGFAGRIPPHALEHVWFVMEPNLAPFCRRGVVGLPHEVGLSVFREVSAITVGCSEGELESFEVWAA